MTPLLQSYDRRCTATWRQTGEVGPSYSGVRTARWTSTGTGTTTGTASATPAAEFWAGNDVIHALTQNGNTHLRISVMDWTRVNGYAEYQGFKVSAENTKYKMTVGSYKGNIGKLLHDTKNLFLRSSVASPDGHGGFACEVKCLTTMVHDSFRYDSVTHNERRDRTILNLVDEATVFVRQSDIFLHARNLVARYDSW